MVREGDSSRRHALVRGVLPAAVTLPLLYAGFAVQEAATGVVAAWSRIATLPANVLANGGLYVLLTVLALWIATRLDRRPYTAYGLDVDRAWLRNVLVGATISLVAIGATIWYASVRGITELEATIDPGTPEGVLALVGGVALLATFLVFSNVYEEVVYRGIVLQTFAEGLAERGLSPLRATLLASVGSLLCFGAFHLLRGPLVAIDAAVIGVTFTLAYLVTGELGLAIGVHAGRIPMHLLVAGEEMGLDLAAIAYPTDPLSYLEFTLLQIGLVSVLVLAWAYHVRGEVRIAESVYTPGSGAD